MSRYLESLLLASLVLSPAACRSERAASFCNDLRLEFPEQPLCFSDPSPVSNDRTYIIGVADFDGDGLEDLLGPGIGVAWNEGGRQFSSQPLYDPGDAEDGALAAELDGSTGAELIFWTDIAIGVLDISVSRQANAAWTSPVTRAPTDLAGPGNYVQVAVGDVDADGDADIVTTWGTVVFWQNDGALQFSGTSIGAADEVYAPSASVAIADLNGDGAADVLVNNADYDVNPLAQVFWGIAGGSPVPSQDLLEPFAIEPDVIDLNGDALMDIVGETQVLLGDAADPREGSPPQLYSASFLHTGECNDLTAQLTDSTAIYLTLQDDSDSEDGSYCTRGTAYAGFSVATGSTVVAEAMAALASGVLELPPGDNQRCYGDAVYLSDLDGDGYADLINRDLLDDTSVFFGRSCRQ